MVPLVIESLHENWERMGRNRRSKYLIIIIIYSKNAWSKKWSKCLMNQLTIWITFIDFVYRNSPFSGNGKLKSEPYGLRYYNSKFQKHHQKDSKTWIHEGRRSLYLRSNSIKLTKSVNSWNKWYLLFFPYYHMTLKYSIYIIERTKNILLTQHLISICFS